MASPSSSSIVSSPIPGDTYFADLYAPFAFSAVSPTFDASIPPTTPPRSRSMGPSHRYKPSHPPRPAPYRPRLEFASMPYQPGLLILPSREMSLESPLTPESPLREFFADESTKKLVYTVFNLGDSGEVKDEEAQTEELDKRAIDHKSKRRAQNRAAQRAFRARQTERVTELLSEIERLTRELEILKRGCGNCGRRRDWRVV